MKLTDSDITVEDFLVFLEGREKIGRPAAIALTAALMDVNINNVRHWVGGTKNPSRQTLRFLAILRDYISRLAPDLSACYQQTTGRPLKRAAATKKQKG